MFISGWVVGWLLLWIDSIAYSSPIHWDCYSFWTHIPAYTAKSTDPTNVKVKLRSMFRWGIHKPPSTQPCLRSEPSILTLHHLTSNMLSSCKAFSSLQGDDKQLCLLVFKPFENWFRITTSFYITLYIYIDTMLFHVTLSCVMLYPPDTHEFSKLLP